MGAGCPLGVNMAQRFCVLGFRLREEDYVALVLLLDAGDCGDAVGGKF